MKHVHVIVLAIAFLFLRTDSGASGTPYEREALKGARRFYVMVEKMDSEAEVHGISEESIRTAIELRLRNSGIEVADSSYGSPFLTVSVNFLFLRNNPNVVYHIEADVCQFVFLARDGTSGTMATTWEDAGILGIVPVEEIAPTIREGLIKVMDEFLNDYLAANPKN